jgi:hypothetical protein
MSNSYVLPVRKGGLGNQMFQVAAAVIQSREKGGQVVLPLEQPHIHKTQGVSYEETVFKEFPLRMNCLVDDAAIQALCIHKFQKYPGEPGFEAWNVLETSSNLLLHGYFQYYPPIGRHEEFIRSLYLKGLEDYLAGTNDPTCIGIHVRRGDYVKFADIHYLQDESYYKAALDQIAKPPNVHYKLFSDDLDWCKQQPIFQTLPNLEYIDEPNEIKTLALMTQCHGGFVCANSTFSWWGAFLGAHVVRAPVVVPKAWMKDFSGDLFPPEWKQV